MLVKSISESLHDYQRPIYWRKNIKIKSFVDLYQITMQKCTKDKQRFGYSVSYVNYEMVMFTIKLSYLSFISYMFILKENWFKTNLYTKIHAFTFLFEVARSKRANVFLSRKTTGKFAVESNRNINDRNDISACLFFIFFISRKQRKIISVDFTELLQCVETTFRFI